MTRRIDPVTATPDDEFCGACGESGELIWVQFFRQPSGWRCRDAAACYARDWPEGISDYQRNGIAELLGKLDRPYPPGGIGNLSFTEAGDLIIRLRAEVLAQTEGTE